MVVHEMVTGRSDRIFYPFYPSILSLNPQPETLYLNPQASNLHQAAYKMLTSGGDKRGAPDTEKEEVTQDVSADEAEMDEEDVEDTVADGYFGAGKLLKSELSPHAR